MSEFPKVEQTQRERDAFAALSRKSPVEELERERTVRALQERGLLGSWRHQQKVRLSRIARQVAAALVLFCTGVAIGDRLGGEPLPGKGVPAGPESPLEMTVAVQQAGTQYVETLTVLSKLPGSGEDSRDSARQTVRNTLMAAAEKVAQLYPEDALTGGLEGVLDSQLPGGSQVRALGPGEMVSF